MDWKGCVCRMRNCVLDLLSMEEDLEEEEDEETWELMSTTLRLKSTFLFCDFNQVISSARDERQKALLTDLANKLFYNLEQAILFLYSPRSFGATPSIISMLFCPLIDLLFTSLNAIRLKFSLVAAGRGCEEQKHVCDTEQIHWCSSGSARSHSCSCALREAERE